MAAQGIHALTYLEKYVERASPRPTSRAVVLSRALNFNPKPTGPGAARGPVADRHVPRVRSPSPRTHSPGPSAPRAVSTSLPVELQRVVHTIQDIDERCEKLRARTKERVDACLAMPSASSRQASAEDAARTKEISAEVEKNHADIAQLSLEKVRLASIAMEMIQYNIRDLDKELAPFAEEMRVKNEAGFDAADEFAVDGEGGAVDPMSMAFGLGGDLDQAQAPTPREYKPKKSQQAKHLRSPNRRNAQEVLSGEKPKKSLQTKSPRHPNRRKD